jgi:hypothetical protein
VPDGTLGDFPSTMGPNDQLAKANRLAMITQRVGFTLWHVQEFEGIAATHFVLFAQATQGMGEAAGAALLEKAHGKTFGATVQQMAKAGLLPTDIERRLTALLAERNWLVHRSRATNQGAVHSDTAALVLVRRLDAIVDDTTALMNDLAELAGHHSKVQGMPGIAEAAAQLVEQWHSMGPG